MENKNEIENEKECPIVLFVSGFCNHEFRHADVHVIFARQRAIWIRNIHNAGSLYID